MSGNKNIVRNGLYLASNFVKKQGSNISITPVKVKSLNIANAEQRSDSKLTVSTPSAIISKPSTSNGPSSAVVKTTPHWSSAFDEPSDLEESSDEEADRNYETNAAATTSELHFNFGSTNDIPEEGYECVLCNQEKVKTKFVNLQELRHHIDSIHVQAVQESDSEENDTKEAEPPVQSDCEEEDDFESELLYMEEELSTSRRTAVVDGNQESQQQFNDEASDIKITSVKSLGSNNEAHVVNNQNKTIMVSYLFNETTRILMPMALPDSPTFEVLQVDGTSSNQEMNLGTSVMNSGNNNINFLQSQNEVNNLKSNYTEVASTSRPFSSSCVKGIAQRHQSQYIRAETRNDCGPWVCSQCPAKSYRRFALYQKHLEKHNGKLYKCDICNKVLRSKPTWLSHIKYHANKSNHCSCEICGKSFLARKGYVIHMKTHGVFSNGWEGV